VVEWWSGGVVEWWGDALLEVRLRGSADLSPQRVVEGVRVRETCGLEGEVWG
jgi:hypothetical protein